MLEHLTSAEKLVLAASPYPSAKALIEDARLAVADAVLDRVAPDGIVRTKADFDARARRALVGGRRRAVPDGVADRAHPDRSRARSDRAVRGQNSLTLLGALNDVRGQLAGLIFPCFVSRTGIARLAHLPRYLQGMVDRVTGSPTIPDATASA